MSNLLWAAHELAGADLGDARLNQRLVTLVAALAAQPEASFPQACGTWAATKAAYRFLSSERITPQAIRDAQHERVIRRAGSARQVLVLQDTTDLDFTTQGALHGVGPLNASAHQGLKVHSGLVVSLAGVPFGVLWQQVWARDAETTGKSQDWRKRPLEDKESRKWLTGVDTTAWALPTTVQYITVGDREADMYPLLAHPRAPNSDYVLRAAYDRCISEEAHTLHAALAASPLLGTQTVCLSRRKGEEARTVTLHLRTTLVTLTPPAYYKGAYAKVTVQVVLAEESAPPPDQKPIRWVLLTTLPVTTLENAQDIVRYYTYRWLVERYHFVLKSGCRLERLQLETAARVEVALALYNVVAWRLLWLTYRARSSPDVSCVPDLEPHEWKALYATIHQSTHLPPQPPSLRQAVRWIARLGGFLARKGDGEPGVQTLWRGMQRLHDIADTWKLLQPPETYG